MTNRQLERLVGNLQDIMRCPHCSSTYTLSDIHYLGQMETMTFLHMRCESCHTPVFASVALANQDGEILADSLKAEDIAIAGNDELPPVDSYERDIAESDLGFERKQLDFEVDPYAVEPTRYEIPIEAAPSAEKIMAGLIPVSYNDVIDAHTFLKEFEGSFDFLGKA